MKKEKEAAQPAANIIYVGKRTRIDRITLEEKTTAVPDAEVPTWRRNGNKEFNLPEGSVQKKGFYHPDANFLISAYRDEFKRPVRKGE